MSNNQNSSVLTSRFRSRQRIAVVASLTLSLVNFRLQLLKRMVEEGHEVIAFAPDHDAESIHTLESIGVCFVRIPMNRAALSPMMDFRTLLALWLQFRRLKPDLVLPYTMKPIIYGCLAARFAGVQRRFALITGLGFVFSDATQSGKTMAVRQISTWLYRLALKGAERVFVYNDADAGDVRRHRMICESSILTLIPGSGVDLNHYTRSDPPLDPPTFLLIARLLWDKGIVDFVESARLLRRRFPFVRVQLLGPFDSNPTGITPAKIDEWVAEGVVEYLGETRDVRPFLAACTVFVLPTYYREGIPRTILEAMATGRAIITTDTSGCRDTVVEGANGYLVPPRDPAKLAAAMESFVSEPALAIRMGRRSYELACERFNVHVINRLVLGHMKLI